MTMDDFSNSAAFLKIIILIKGIYIAQASLSSESEGIYWAESHRFCFQSGVECCTIIPVRAGNGVMDYYWKKETLVTGYPFYGKSSGIRNRLNAGRVFADAWDLWVVFQM